MAKKTKQDSESTIIKSMRLPTALLDDLNSLVVHLEQKAAETDGAGRLSGKVIFSNVLRALITTGMKATDDDLLAEVERLRGTKNRLPAAGGGIYL